METIQLTSTQVYQFNIFKPYHEVRHFITTRIGGNSEGPYKGLNIGFGSEDNPSVVLENRYILAESLGIPLDWFVFPHQTHSNHVYKVTANDKGKGAYARNNAIPDTDALVTNCKHICLSIQVADCVPILLFDTHNQIIGAIHAGWRGMANQIIGNTINFMLQNYGSKPQHIIAGIGPSIGPCCYEVGEEISLLFPSQIRSQIFYTKINKIILDLWKSASIQLISSGLKAENIESAHVCTRCHSNLFYSSRAGKGITGRFMAGIMLL